MELHFTVKHVKELRDQKCKIDTITMIRKFR